MPSPSSKKRSSPSSKSGKKAAVKKGAKKGAGKARRKGQPSYGSYILRVLKDKVAGKDTKGITGEAMNVMKNLVDDLEAQITREAIIMMRKAKKKTMKDRDIQASVRELLKKDLSKDAVAEGVKAKTTYKMNESEAAKKKLRKDSDKKVVSLAQQAGLIFPAGRVLGHLKNGYKEEGKAAPRVSPTAAVYLAAVLQYVTEYVLEVASNETKLQRIKPENIKTAIDNEGDLKKLFGHVTIKNGGIDKQQAEEVKDEIAKLKPKKGSPKKGSTTSPKKNNKGTSPTKKKKRASAKNNNKGDDDSDSDDYSSDDYAYVATDYYSEDNFSDDEY
jgi:histone H2A